MSEEDNSEPLTKNPIEDEEPILELGDRIRLLGGKHDKTTGRIIYRTVEELHLMPDGLTNSALIFALTEDGFDPELGVESVEILSKRKKPSLIEILDLNVDQILETFGPDGEAMSRYTIVKIIPEEDAILLQNEEEGEVSLSFNFRGIPKDLPFRVIRSRQPEPEVQEEVVKQEEGEDEYVEILEDFAFLDDELEEVPAEEYLIEIPRSERIYTAIEQKSEAYADLLSLSSLAMQKLQGTQKSVKILTELFFQLRTSILRVSDDGNPVGVKPATVQTLVDTLEGRVFRLSRPVIDASKRIYYDIDSQEEPQPENLDGLILQNFDEAVISSVNYLAESTDMAGQKFSSFFNGYLNRYTSTWAPINSPRTAFQMDEEVFRRKAPDEESTIPGYSRGLPDKKLSISSDMVTEVSMSLLRGLKSIKTRTQLLQSGEEAAVLAYVVFPLIYSNSLMITERLESLIADVEAGLFPLESMKDILKTGEITDIPSMSQPFLVSVDGGTLGNIPLREYLKSVTNLKAEGMGDIWRLQTILGMKEKEWTIDQHAVLNEIIKRTQNQILNEIIRQREVLAQLVSQPPAVQGIQMTPDGPAMIEKLAGEPHLLDIQKLIKEQMPAFAASDVALVGLLLRHHPEMAFAQLADQPASLTRERMRYARNEYLMTIRTHQLRQLRAANAGLPPEPINCAHVKPLQMIRKVKDTKTRLALMSKFLTTFQGTKEDNWLKCNAGNHNLLCVHELLQIYQYLRPGDVAALNKDIQLNFGGGQFQGYYICRNCGQPISEVEFDTHIEFDDEGRPMMGRSELVDKDAITLEEIDQIIGPIGMDLPEEFDNETKKLIFTTAKQLADKLFAPLDLTDYLVIVGRVFAMLQQIPTRERYIQLQQSQRKSKTATLASAASDYDIYINQALVCSVAVHILLVIQTKKPDIILRGNPGGCRSLGGQPLEETGMQGITCIVSVLSSIQNDSPPWSLTQFQKDPDDSSRQKKVMSIFEPILKSALQDPTLLQALSQKRDYRRKILGAAGGQGRPDEVLPPNFAPIPYAMDASDFVEKVIVPEAATVEDRAELWIRQGNMLAKKNKLPMPLTFSETSCCISPLSKIDTFWKESRDSLPAFAKREGIPKPPKITRTEPTMKPSQIVRPLPDAPEESYYLLFLKVCYDGEQKGQSHEFGLTKTCIWCNLKMTEVSDGAAAVEGQGVEVTKESFEDLLNETHRVNSFKSRMRLEVPGPLDTWTSLMEMDPEPAIGYREVMAKTQVALMKLPPDAKEVEVALALSDVSILANEMEHACKIRLPSNQHGILDSIVKDGAESITRFLQSYVSVPLRQLISKQAPTPNIPKSWDLSSQHQTDLLMLLNAHRGYLAKFNKIIITPWLKAKVETFLSQTRSILDILEQIRPLQVPGTGQTYEYLLKFCLYAPIGNLIDPNVLPLVSNDIEAPASQVEQQALFPAKFMSEMIGRFKEEGFKLTPEQVRELIAERNEKEKANILKNMTAMSRAGKEIEMIKMRLGLGDWSVGGTKGIYAYDQERYDIERDQRAQAGIMDFPGYGPEGPRAQEQQLDMFGFAMGGREEGYIGDDQLAGIMGFDDE